MPSVCLTLLGPPSVEEKLLDLLLDAVGDDVFTSIPMASHGTSHGRLSAMERVMGRSATVQIQVLLGEQEAGGLLQRLREEFRGTGLRYWTTPLLDAGEIE